MNINIFPEHMLICSFIPKFLILLLTLINKLNLAFVYVLLTIFVIYSSASSILFD